MSGTWKEWGRAVLEAGAILIVLFLFLWPVHIDGNSMENTLFHGDGVLINRISIYLSHYKPGDILVFQWEEDGKKLLVVKRVIAMAGDTVHIEDGKVFVNENQLEETYAVGTTLGNMTVKVPQGEVFFMGDNRQYSYDSREMGTIPRNKLVGKVLFRWYPFSQMRKF